MLFLLRIPGFLSLEEIDPAPSLSYCFAAGAPDCSCDSSLIVYRGSCFMIRFASVTFLFESSSYATSAVIVAIVVIYRRLVVTILELVKAFSMVIQYEWALRRWVMFLSTEPAEWRVFYSGRRCARDQWGYRFFWCRAWIYHHHRRSEKVFQYSQGTGHFSCLFVWHAQSGACPCFISVCED